MATFIVISLEQDKAALDKLITDRFGNASLRLENGDWLVAYIGTSKQLSDELDVTNGDKGVVIILNFHGYYGFAKNSIWEWINEFSRNII